MKCLLSESTCTHTWNPGVWPYLTHCVLVKGHDLNHRDSQGREERP